METHEPVNILMVDANPSTLLTYQGILRELDVHFINTPPVVKVGATLVVARG